MRLNITSTPVTAKTRKLPTVKNHKSFVSITFRNKTDDVVEHTITFGTTTYTLEMAQDFKAMHGIDIERELLNILAFEAQSLGF